MTKTELPKLRTSERTAFKRCQAYWKWNYVDGLKPKHEKLGALWFGTGIHLALQERYKYTGKKRGKAVLKVWREYCEGTQVIIYGDEYGEDPEKYWNALELGEKMLGGYLDKYGKDENWFIISAEQAIEVPIRRPLRLANPLSRTSPYIVEYLAAFDIVARNEETDDSLWLWDHKTAATITTDHLVLDDQAGSYWALAPKVLAKMGLVPKGTVLDGILYNFLRKSPPDPRPVNAEGMSTNNPLKADYFAALDGIILESREDEGPRAAHAKMTIPQLAEFAELAGIPVLGQASKRQPLPNFHREEVWRTPEEQRTQIRRIANEALHIELVREGLLPILKTPTKDNCRMCPFSEMCELHEQGADWKEFRDLAYVKGDPYGDHYTKESGSDNGNV